MITLLGIRHHGPGSARSVRQALDSLQPDCLLVEGPPEADSLIPLCGLQGMVPPVALLLYVPDEPKKSAFYPFAEFSPEWQAIQYAIKNHIPVRFMDLEQRYQLPLLQESLADLPEDAAVEPESAPLDPFGLIARAAHYSDGERWWEHFVEQRRSNQDVFQGILELMTALRSEIENNSTVHDPITHVREAAMRTIIRAVQAQGYQNIGIVCGAWHAPALVDLDTARSDEKVLSDFLSKSRTKPANVVATWIPWTYDRLSRRSGYGAGIDSPGWYEHLWSVEDHIVERWMVKVAQLMRAEDLNISPAHAIEAARLAEALAALRGRPLPGLPELDEAVQAIFCFGDGAPLRLIREKLIVGVRMGSVPLDAPTVPLQRDLSAAQKRVRLEPSASPEVLDLDLRKPLLLERSQLLHRMNLLDIPWGQVQATQRAKGTFHEIWQIEWKPEFAVAVIEASLWGNTIREAAGNRIQSKAEGSKELPALTQLLESALFADLPESIPNLIEHLQHLAATNSDIFDLMESLLPLVNALRYGNVRQTDTGIVQHVVDELISRICIGLPSACSTLDDLAAEKMFSHINGMQNTLAILENESHTTAWEKAMENLLAQESIHGLVRGRACRILFDRPGKEEEIEALMSQALSPGTPPPQGAAWVEGFLKGSGQVLIHDPRLWASVDAWVLSLPEETFNTALPILRRTFSTFPAPERRQIGEMAKSGGRILSTFGEVRLDPERAEKALTLARLILGIDQPL